VLAEDAFDFVRLRAIGFGELCWPEDFDSPPEEPERTARLRDWAVCGGSVRRSSRSLRLQPDGCADTPTEIVEIHGFRRVDHEGITEAEWPGILSLGSSYPSLRLFSGPLTVEVTGMPRPALEAFERRCRGTAAVDLYEWLPECRQACGVSIVVPPVVENRARQVSGHGEHDFVSGPAQSCPPVTVAHPDGVEQRFEDDILVEQRNLERLSESSCDRALARTG
jgi:hypothetical protein